VLLMLSRPIFSVVCGGHGRRSRKQKAAVLKPLKKHELGPTVPLTNVPAVLSQEQPVSGQGAAAKLEINKREIGPGTMNDSLTGQ
jgi:hypothetical protein